MIEGRMTKVYRELVLLSRKKYSHREQLMIEIMKTKCYKLEIRSRGGAKVSNSLGLLEYETKILIIIEKMLIIANLSCDILDLLKLKDPKREIFLQKVMALVQEINAVKIEFEKGCRLFRSAIEINCLLELLFEEIYNDGLFVRSINKERKEEVRSSAQIESQKKIFGKDVTLILISVLDEVGRIKRVSKNLPNVLGFNAHHIMGLSIN